jgi:hypothetical protein
MLLPAQLTVSQQQKTSPSQASIRAQVSHKLDAAREKVELLVASLTRTTRALEGSEREVTRLSKALQEATQQAGGLQNQVRRCDCMRPSFQDAACLRLCACARGILEFAVLSRFVRLFTDICIA